MFFSRSRAAFAALALPLLIVLAGLGAAQAQTVTVVSGAPALVGTNLVTNGDFETGTSCFPADYFGPTRAGATTISGWTAGGGGTDTYARVVCGAGAVAGNSVYFGNGYIRDASPAIGAASFTFDADGKLVGALPTFTLRTVDTQLADPNCCNWGSSGQPVTLAQSIATTIGATYRVRFTVRSEGGGGAAAGVWRVQIGAGTVDLQIPAGNQNNQSFTLQFVATAATSTLTFINWGHVGNNSGGFCNPATNDYCTVGGLVGVDSSEPTLDNVQVVLVATPVIGIAKAAGAVTNNLDGTFSVPITLVVRNYGSENLNAVTVSDALNGASPAFGTYNAAATPAYGNYTIQTAPAFSGACATLALTGGFTGSTGTQQVASGTLPTTTACTITYTVRWFPASQSTFTTQASAAGTGAVSAGATSDLSDDGANPDTNGNNNPNEAGENDPTTVTVPAGSTFACGNMYTSGGGAGSATSIQINSISGGVFSANLTGLPFASAAIAVDTSGRLWYAEYFAGGGAARLGYFDSSTNVHHITAATFPGGAASIVRMSIDNSGTAYVIDNANNLYSFAVGASPTISSLGALSFAAASPSGTTSSGDIAFDLSGNGWAIFGNSLYYLNPVTRVATPIAQLKVGGVALNPATDIVAGLAFDNLNRMHVSILGSGVIYRVDHATLELTVVANPGKAIADLGSCTIPAAITPPRVDVVKAAGSVTAVSATVFDVSYTIRVGSTGAVPAPYVQVNDYLPNTFSSGAPAITIQTAPAVTAGTCTANAAFNGNADTRLLAGTNALNAGASCTITVTVRLTYAAAGSVPATAQNNYAYASSHPASPNAGHTFPGGTATVPASAWSTDQSTNGNSLPGSPNGDAASVTPVSFVAPRIGVARQAGAVTNNLDGTFTVPFTVVVRNYAAEALNAVTLTDVLNGASPLFGTQTAGTPAYGQYTISTAPAFSGACATLSLTAGFTGSTGNQQLAAGTLPVAGACTITYGVRFFPAAQTSFTTQTTANGTGATSSLATSDLSDDGANPDPNANNNPNEAGENDPTTVTVPTGSAFSCNSIVTAGGNAGTSQFFDLNIVNTGGGSLNATSTGMAFTTFATGSDPSGKVWYVEAPVGGGAARIAYFDPSTNTHTITSSTVPIPGGFHALRLGIDSVGTAYLIDNQTVPGPRLYSFTTVASPVVSNIGAVSFAAASPSGATFSGDLAIDQSGRAWAVFGNALWLLDTATAIATPIGQFRLGGAAYTAAQGVIVGIAFDTTGRLYVSSQPAGGGNGEIYEINKTTLAMTLVVSAASSGKGFSDLSSCASPTLIVPTIDVIKSAGSVTAVSATVFDVPYTVRVVNTSSFQIPNVQVNDYLPNTFSSGSPAITIQTAPAVTAGTCTANAAYNGNADTRLLAGTNALDASAACTITFTVRLTYAAAGSVPSAAQNNSAYASSHPATPNAGHTYPGGTPTAPAGAWSTDQSTNGAVLPGGPHSDAPSVTPVTLTGQRIDVVKAAAAATQVSGLVFDVPYTVRVGNLGTIAATNVQVNDYLPGTFSSGSPAIAIQSAPTVTAGGCTANAAFNGNADTRLLAGTDSLATTATCTLTFTVRLTYASVAAVPSAAQNNSAYASTAVAANSGYTFPGGVVTGPVSSLATDQSTNGNALPGTANGDAASITPVTLPLQRIDVVKSVGAVTVVSATVFDIPYTVRVGNLGTVTSTNVQVNDYLPGTFSTGAPVIAIQTAAAVTAGACTVNPAFNGNADTRLLAGSDSLAASASCTITVTVRVTYGSVGVIPSGAQNNLAYASTAAAVNAGYTFPGGVATAPGTALATDVSNNSNALPGTVNSDGTSPTPVTFTVQRIDVVKSAGAASVVSPTVFDIPYTVRVGNLGTVAATNVQVNDYLPNTFSTGAPAIAIQTAAAVTAGGCTVNGAFNGNADTRLLAGTDSLAVSATCTITFTVRVTYASIAAVPSAAQNNSAYASTAAAANSGYTFPGGTATVPGGALATDQSTNGNALPGAPGGDAPSVTPVLLPVQRIDVVKSAGAVSQVSATVFDVPYTLRVGNLGTVTATNVQVNDYLPATFSTGSPALAITVAPAVTAGACTANAAFNGNADTRLLAGSDSLAASASCTITFTVRVTYALVASVPSTPQNNTAYASTAAAVNAGYTFPGGIATVPGAALATDQSTNGNALPGTPGGDAPSVTPVTFSSQRIDVVKAAGAVSQVSALVFDIPYTVRVGNLAATTATNVQVNDYLPGTFASGTPAIAIQAAPAITAGACVANAAFNGNADTRLLAGTDSLATNANCTITFTVRLTYASAGVIPSAAQNNSAYASTAGAANAGYTFPGGAATPPVAAFAVDQSTNGNALPGTPGGDAASVTPVTLPSQRIDVVKAAGAVSQVGALAFDIPYTVRVGNLAATTATNVQVNDYLPGTFASGTPAITIQAAPTVTVGACTANAAFNGNADTRLLAGTNSLATSATCTITFTVRLTYASAGVIPLAAQNNTAYASTAGAVNAGYTFPGGVATAPGGAFATDQSTNGNALPGTPGGDAPSVTPVTLPSQRIDVVKAAGAVSQVSALVFDVPYTVRVGNLGATSATNVQVNDFLPNTFSAGTPAIAISTAPVATAGCTVNGAFNGNADSRLLAGTDTLAASANCTITFTVRLTYASAAAIPSAAQNNTAYASTAAAANSGYTFPGGTATAPVAAIATDLSSSANALPGTPGGDTPGPTPVTLVVQRLDVVLAAGAVTRVSATVFDIPYTAIVKNTGTVTATNVQVNDYLPTTFASGSPAIAIQTAPAVSAGGCAAGAGFNGNATTALLAGTDSLPANASCTITFTVRITYPSVGAIPSGTLNNSAYASSAASGPNSGYSFPGGAPTAPVAALAIDTSTDGSTLPGSAGGDTPTPTPVTLPASATAVLSGYVWIDSNKNRTLDPGETVVPDFGVEVTNVATGAIVACSASNNPLGAGGCITVGSNSLFRTGIDGLYQVTGLVPGAYQVRFRDPANTVIFSTPVNGSGDAASRVDPGGAFLTVTLTAGANVTQQSLPLDPAGVVYNSTTRAVVPGATVQLCGPAGFNPATMLIGGGYMIAGNCASMVTGATGAYQYLLTGAAPSGTYTIGVTPPTGFIAPSIAIPPQAIALTPPAGPGQYLVQAQSGPPSGGQPTTYYLAINLSGGSRDVLNNHIPVDPISGTSLFVAKSASTAVVELGDSLGYTITVRNPTAGAIANVVLADTLPAGFRYLPATVRVNGIIVSEPIGAPGPVLTLPLGALVANQVATITYRVRVGVGAMQGDGINRAAASGAGGVVSNVATAKVRVTGGVFTDEACVIGKIYVDCNRNSMQDAGNSACRVCGSISPTAPISSAIPKGSTATAGCSRGPTPSRSIAPPCRAARVSRPPRTATHSIRIASSSI